MNPYRCSYCRSPVAYLAQRCPSCTSHIGWGGQRPGVNLLTFKLTAAAILIIVLWTTIVDPLVDMILSLW